jgi:DNA-binding HxlR family transcriptional regulator
VTVSTQVSDVSTLQRLLTDGVLPAACPTRVVLDHVTSRWGVLLLVALSERTLRWGELRRVVEGISEKMLAQTLRTLEAPEPGQAEGSVAPGATNPSA